MVDLDLSLLRSRMSVLYQHTVRNIPVFRSKVLTGIFDHSETDSIFLCHGHFRLSIDAVKWHIVFCKGFKEQFSFILRSKSDIETFQICSRINVACPGGNDLSCLIFTVAVYNVETSVKFVKYDCSFFCSVHLHNIVSPFVMKNFIYKRIMKNKTENENKKLPYVGQPKNKYF